jgi:hypothetical protein
MRRLVLALTFLLLLAGCSSIKFPFLHRIPGMGEELTLEGLQQALAFQASSFAGTVSTAADDITSATRDRRIRKNALLWRLHMVPVAQRAAFQADPRAGYVQSLLVTVLQRRYFETGDGRDLFGAQQGVAIEAARRLEQQAVEIGQRFLKPSKLSTIVAEANEYAEKYPIQGREFSMQRVLSGVEDLQESEIINTVLSIPLAPFRALEGVDSGAQAIRDFNLTARRFTDVVAQLPEQTRGELELFLYDFEDRETVVESLAALESLATSADRASATVEGLPADLRASLEATLKDSRSTVAQLAATAEQLRALAGPLDSAAQNLRDASLAWREVIGSQAERAAEPNTGPPFDVREWGSAATAIGDAATKLRGLALEAGTLSSSDVLTSALDRSIDRAFWRGIELLALFFGLLIAYRLIASRLARSA